MARLIRCTPDGSGEGWSTGEPGEVVARAVGGGGPADPCWCGEEQGHGGREAGAGEGQGRTATVAGPDPPRERRVVGKDGGSHWISGGGGAEWPGPLRYDAGEARLLEPSSE